MDQKAEFVTPQELREEIHSFKKFAFRQNLIDISIALMLSNAFNRVVVGINELLFMPVIKYVSRTTGGNWKDWRWEVNENLVFEVGKLLSLGFDFAITAILAYIIYVKIIQQYFRTPKAERPKEKPKEKEKADI